MHSVIQTVKYLFTYYLLLFDCGCQKLRKLRPCIFCLLCLTALQPIFAEGSSWQLPDHLPYLQEVIQCSLQLIGVFPKIFISCTEGSPAHCTQAFSPATSRKRKRICQERKVLPGCQTYPVYCTFINIPFLARNFLYNPK